MAEKVTIGNCELWLGDCMDYMRGLTDKAFDLAIVDPPYGLPKTSTNGAGKLAHRVLNQDKMEWDIAPDERYFSELMRVSTHQIIWGGNYFCLPSTRGIICWDKDQHMPTFSKWEMAWTSFFKPAEIWKGRSLDLNRIHPSQKPVALYEWLLTNYAKPGQRILDTHLGSGSSAIAANGLGFEFVGIELDADYYAAACKRIEQAYAQPRLFEDKVGAGDTAVQGDMLLPANALAQGPGGSSPGPAGAMGSAAATTGGEQ